MKCKNEMCLNELSKYNKTGFCHKHCHNVPRKRQETDDIIGKTYGRLTVLERAASKSASSVEWVCQCSCGEKVVASTARLRNRKQTLRSCGCIQRERREAWASGKEVHFNSGRKSYDRGRTRGQKKIVVIRNSVFNRSGTEIVWNLTLEEENTVAEWLEGRCIYCGIPAGKAMILGLDRVDSSVKEYVVGNIVPCCKICNISKNELSLDEWRHWIKRVHNYTFQS